ncbi:hypothetical protein F9222_24365 [Escherichia coli]|nr:hypothetical protein F9222_24365 [Escherichia coli]
MEQRCVSPEKMMPLQDELRGQYEIRPVCNELHITPSTYYRCQQQWHQNSAGRPCEHWHPPPRLRTS